MCVCAASDSCRTERTYEQPNLNLPADQVSHFVDMHYYVDKELMVSQVVDMHNNTSKSSSSLVKS